MSPGGENHRRRGAGGNHWGSRSARLALLLAALLALPAPATAYTRSTTSSTDPAGIAWDLDNDGTALPNVTGGQVGFCLHHDGSNDIFDGSDLAALEQAFRTWSGVTGAALQFVR